MKQQLIPKVCPNSENPAAVLSAINTPGYLLITPGCVAEHTAIKKTKTKTNKKQKIIHCVQQQQNIPYCIKDKNNI